MKQLNERKILVFLFFMVCLLMFFSQVSRAQEVAASIDLGAYPGPEDYAYPQEVAIDTSTNTIYAPFGYKGSFHEGWLAVIDGATDTLITTIPLVGGSPWGIAFNQITQKIYAAHQNGGGVTVIDSTTNDVINRINPSYRASGVAVDSKSNKIYATQENSYKLWVIDGETDEHIATYNIGVFRPALLVFNANSNKLYIANNSSGPLKVFDTTTNTVVNSIHVGHGGHLALDLVNNRLYISQVWGESVKVIDLTTENIIATIPLNAPIIGVGYNPNTNRIYASRGTTHTEVIDASTLEPIKTLPVGNYGIGINLITNKVYIAERSWDIYRPGIIYVVQDKIESFEVYVDIKPGSCPNPVNTKSGGVLPVSILGTEDFDVTAITPETILLSREGFEDAGVSPIRYNYEDVSTPFKRESCECHDSNGDGYMDMVLKFKTQDLVKTLNLVEFNGLTIPLEIKGNLYEGNGGASFKGSDCIKILSTCKGKK